MPTIDIKHLDHVKGMIVAGIKQEMKEEILATHSISDQLNASGTTATAIKADISAILTTGHAKQEAVKASTTFDELNAVVPMREDE